VTHDAPGRHPQRVPARGLHGGPADRIRRVRSADDHAIILTVGDEITSGDVANTNGSWLAGRLAALGLPVRMLAAVPDDVDEIAGFVREHRPLCRWLIVTGGLGGTPDDVTRDAVARAFGVELEADAASLARLRDRFPAQAHAYVERFALLPAGAEPVENPLGGAPGFRIENVVVLAGVPAEMEATYDVAERTLLGSAGRPIRAVRLSYPTTESTIVAVLERATDEHPAVAVGSYPQFEGGIRRVDIVLKSTDPSALDAAAAWMGQELGQVLSSP
jgi:nicotinamide-nucleotide amidase